VYNFRQLLQKLFGSRHFQQMISNVCQ
jgi:hypothetical protein